MRFDRKASISSLVAGACERGRKSMYWLVRYVTNYRWTLPSLRLTLMDIYVRSVLQFGCVVWYPPVLNDTFVDEHPQFRPLGVLYRRLLRTMLALPSRIHNIFLYVLSNRFPLQLIVAKLVHRYFKRVELLSFAD
jgi:hypothetical protein